MPSHIIPSKPNQQTKPKLHPRKLIKKDPKMQHQRFVQNSSDCDCDENTMTETISQEIVVQEYSSIKDIAAMLRNAIQKFRYAADTHLVCLSLLALIKIQIPQCKTRLIAAALLMIAGKIHEFRCPKLLDLIIWGRHQFNRNDLIGAECTLLTFFNFRVPVIFQALTLQEIQLAVIALEKKIFQCTPNFQ